MHDSATHPVRWAICQQRPLLFCACLAWRSLKPSRHSHHFETITLNLAVAAVQVPTNLAKGIKLVPIKLARGVKQLADGDDNKEAVISDIFPKPAEASA